MSFMKQMQNWRLNWMVGLVFGWFATFARGYGYIEKTEAFWLIFLKEKDLVNSVKLSLCDYICYLYSAVQ